jgi:fumarate reductase flavoprotein subunit
LGWRHAEEEQEIRADAVILATGGYGANQRMLQELCPEAAACPTTNGPWATGDGVVLAERAGALLVDLDKVPHVLVIYQHPRHICTAHGLGSSEPPSLVLTRYMHCSG